MLGKGFPYTVWVYGENKRSSMIVTWGNPSFRAVEIAWLRKANTVPERDLMGLANLEESQNLLGDGAAARWIPPVQLTFGGIAKPLQHRRL